MELDAETRGVSEAASRLNGAGAVITSNLRTAMSKSVLTVEADAKSNWPVGVSGASRNSIKSEVTQAGATVSGAVGSSITSPYPYPAVIEYGRRPGRMPPPSALIRWVQLVLGVEGSAASGVAFLVARAIGRRGIKGRYILTKAIQRNTPRIMGFFADAAAKIKRQLEGG